jgi:hypothetical protein
MISRFVIRDIEKELYWMDLDVKRDPTLTFTCFIKHAKKLKDLEEAEKELVKLPKGIYCIEKLYKV